jgi:hypothetical protein
MTQIVRQRYGFGEILVEAKRPRNATRYLRHLQSVGEARSRVIALRKEKNLRLVFETSE